MNDFLEFKKLITSPLIKILYILNVIIITLSGIGLMFTDEILLGLAVIIFGNLWWRLMCEFVIVIFRIHDTLVDISSSKSKK
ncbi:MAG: DUF4282 domain-containing protein [Candidatus Aenigmarchaeota archaeon]|nr:DUF4282 domain-containing protein [Candidatus Aenigmarchaeota archaeon]